MCIMYDVHKLEDSPALSLLLQVYSLYLHICIHVD